MPELSTSVLTPRPCALHQVIVEKAYAGDTDHIKHALDLFVDFAAIFVRLVIILLKSQWREQA